ncbi:efflux RND transporter permease subunit [Pelagicoccus sp. SDUM812003]|uniref:efflux RND transporter permease subunit n=1 Tax=Pelagicoccus sp. SDUM812003 TaxID=3041267 RepID=UPI00280CD04D|nr:efflux RND transporter permease subunit [Pelagicoccus sp. SDUM812003]MDQ8201867.1 efflux RND transporter permease subunit [Pelagicoccus sp. SDUM812003]
MAEDPIKKHPIIAWFAENSVVSNILMFVILGWGISTAISIRKEAFPNFEADSVTIRVPFNGGVPEDVERGVAIKIEEALQSVDGIDRIRSTSTSGGATVTVEAIEDYPLTRLFNDIKVQVDAISTFPGEAEKPIIIENKSRSSVMWIDVHGEVSEQVLKETARSVRDELLKLPDVNQVTTYGDRDYEISIELSETKLRAYDLTFDEVASAIRNNSVDLSGGTLRSNRGDISLRSRAQAYNAKDFSKIPLRTNADGTRIHLEDVAEIRDGFVDQNYLNRFDGSPTVSLQVTTDGDKDIIKASTQVKDLIDSYEQQFSLPDGVTLTYWNDGSESIRSRLNLLTKNGLQGVALVLLSLSLFLNFRLAAWVAVGIPVSISGALILFDLPGIDISLNLITAFSFIIVLGIIVDDAIVLGESIYSEKESQKHPDHPDAAIRATVRGVSKVLTPATFGVLTTIAAFFPLTQVSGRMGNVFGQIATGVIFCLIFSLIESKLILPSHLAHIDVHKTPKNPIGRFWLWFQSLFAKGLSAFIQKVYKPSLRLAIDFRYITLASFVGLLFVIGALLPSGMLRFVFFPDIFQDNVSANLTLEEGLPVSHLHENTLRIAEALHMVNERIEAETGDRVVRHIQISASSNTGSAVSASLIPSEEREISSGEIVNRWRAAVGQVAGAKALTFSGRAGPPGQGLSIQLESKSLDALREGAEAMKQAVARYAGVYDVKDSFTSGRPEIQVELTPAGQASGFSRRDLANAVRSAFYGIEAQRIQRGRDEVKAMVRYPEEERTQLDTLREMRVRLQDGTAVPISIVATTKFGESLAAIERADYNRIVSVSAEVDKTVSSGDEVLANLAADFFPTFRAQHPEVAISLRGEAEQRMRSLGSLRTGLMVSILLIYILLAIPLKSYLKPLFIMSVIPFGIIGALLGHFIVGISVSILSLFGLLALSGIVVNDSLVLIARIDDLRSEGLSMREAITEAGPQRFRAILLTTLTTFIGLVPILLEPSVQAQFLKPMAVSVGFGVVFATTITLILLPVLLITFDETLGSSFRYYRDLMKRKL